jgi:hypothetical protein
LGKGFYQSFGIAWKVDYDPNELLDLILTRYNDMSYIESLDVDWAFDLFNKAISKRNEDELWDIYLINLSKMEKQEDYYSFEEYKKKLSEPKQVDIVETVEETFKRFKSKVKKK